jgi:hypothetical protein
MTKRKRATTVKTNTTIADTVRNQRPSRKPKTKLAQLEAMLRRPDGATIEQISKSLVWQAHSVRGAMSGALKKKQGLTITNEKTDAGRVYRIA